MAQKILNKWFGGEWQDRAAINANAIELEAVGTDVEILRRLIKQQSQQLLQLRAMFMGVVDVLHAKMPFDDAELERAVTSAWTQLTAPPPPPAQPGGEPYRGHSAPQAPPRMVTCAKCLKQVPATRTNITAAGEVCDACS